jgi:hypothetical protein
MGKDLTIRLLSRPKVSKDSQLGFQTMVRKYVVQGDRACSAGILDATNPLFLSVGTADEEFSDHLLVNQQLEPTQSMEKAYILRTFVRMRERWVSESVSETADLVKLTRTFVVLRAQVSIYGYSTAAWAKHPSYAVAKVTDEDPWDYAPAPVLNGEPGTVNVSNANASAHGLQYDPWVSLAGTSQSLSDYLTANANLGNLGAWVRGNATVNMSSPGVDVWSVTWVTHASPYWTFGTSKGSGKSSGALTMVDFDHNGLKLTSVGASGSGSFALQAKTFNTFYVGEFLPAHLAQIAGGSSSSTSTPSVNLDFTIRIAGGRTISFKQFLKNAIWQMNTSHNLDFPDRSGNQITVGSKDPYVLIFDSSIYDKDSSGKYKDESTSGYPHYQGFPVGQIGGQITWSANYWSYLPSTTTIQGVNTVSTKIAPLFRKDETRIWKIQITYVG